MRKYLLAVTLAVGFAGIAGADGVQPIVPPGGVLFGSAQHTITSSATAVNIDTGTLRLNVTKGAAINSIRFPDGTVATSTAPFGGTGSPSWGSITGTLSNQSDLQAKFVGVGVTTASLQSQVAAVGVSTGSLATAVASSTSALQASISAVALATGTLQTQVTATAASTGTLALNVGIATAALHTQDLAIGVATGTIQTQVNSIAVSTGQLNTSIVAVGVTTGSLQTQLISVGVTTASLQSQVTGIAIATGTIQNSVYFPTQTITDPYGVKSATGVVTYNLNVGSFTGAGLSTCGDTSHALAWNSTTNLYSCQTISASAASSIGFTTGSVNGYTALISSPTSLVVADSSTIVGRLLSATTFYFTVNTASVTAQGNAFNGANQLIKATSGAQYPIIDGNLITNLNANNLSPGVIFNQNSLQAGSTFYVSSGTVTGQLSVGSVVSSYTIVANSNGPFMGNQIYPLSLNYPLIGSPVGVGLKFTQVGQVNGTFFQEFYSGLCSDFSHACTNSPIVIGNSTGQPIIWFNADGRITQGNSVNAYSNYFSSPTLIGPGFSDIAVPPVNGLGVGGDELVKGTFTVTGGGGIVNSYGIKTSSISAATNVGAYVVTASTGLSGPYTIDVSTTGHVNSWNVNGGTVTSCGTSPLLSGSDFAGTITTGSGSPSACTLTFARPFTNTPVCTLSDSLTAITPDVSAISASAVTFSFSGALNSGKIYYICIGSD